MENSSVTILLETMAGKGTECGINLNEIKEIIAKLNEGQEFDTLATEYTTIQEWLAALK